MKKIILIGMITTVSIFACVNSIDCKADIEAYKKDFTQKSYKIWKCVLESKTQIDLSKCESKQKKLFKKPKEEDICKDKKKPI